MADEFDITAEHPVYAAWAPDWSLMRDAEEGERCVKGKGEAYLPMKSAMKAMTDQKAKEAAYKAYRDRAEFPEIVAPTIRGALGLIHGKETVIEVPAALKPLVEKATQDGMTLAGFHQRVTAEILTVGRFGLMPAVTPTVPGQPGGGEFYLAGYAAETAINWDNPRGPLEYLVLDESAQERDPETNKWGKKGRYLEQRVENGRYEYRRWVESDRTTSGGKKEFVTEGNWQGATVKGSRELDIMPFVFVNTMELGAEPDDIPLYGLAKLAYRAYRLDADYTTALHMTSEPTPWITGCDPEKAPTTIGAANLWVIQSELAKCGFLEFTGPGIAAQEKAITSTLERAIMFGAQLFADNRRTAESGEALRLRLGNETSTLKMVSAASAAGLERCLRDAAVWAGANPAEVTVTPNLEFVDPEMTPQDILAMVTAWTSGALRKLDLFNSFQRSGVVDGEIEFEDWQEEIDAEGPPLGMLGTTPDGRPVDDPAQAA